MGHGRTTCHTCRQELWLIKYVDELEFLVVAKGYSVYQARMVIVKMARPICKACRKPITGAQPSALFHKERKSCHAMYQRYTKLRKSGLTQEAALAILT